MHQTVKTIGLVAAGLAAVAVVGTAARSGVGAGATPAADARSGSVTDPAVVAALTDAGCGQLLTTAPTDGPTTVVLVSRTGAMAGAGIPAAVAASLVAAAGGGDDPVGGVTVVTVAGRHEQPQTVATRAALMDPRAGSARRARIAAGLTTCLSALLDAAPRPTGAGSDELLAAQVAGQAAQAARQAGSSRVELVVVSDGQANAGLLDLRDQGFAVQAPRAVVRRIAARDQLPDFAGTAVTYVGLGQGLDGASRDWLGDFYTALCEGAGGTCAVSDEQVPVAAVDGTVPADPSVATISAVPGAPNTFEVSSAAFQPDSTELVSPAQVASELEVVREALAADPSATAAVVGHACDDGSPESGLIRLSTERAQAIAALLASDGVSAGRLAVRGVGASQPTDTRGLGAVDACAAQRRVTITVT